MIEKKKIKSFILQFGYEGPDLLQILDNTDLILNMAKSKAKFLLELKERQIKEQHKSRSKYLEGKKTLNEKQLLREIEIIQKTIAEGLDKIVMQYVNHLLSKKVNSEPKIYFKKLKRENIGRYSLAEIRKEFLKKYPNTNKSTLRKW